MGRKRKNLQVQESIILSLAVGHFPTHPKLSSFSGFFLRQTIWDGFFLSFLFFNAIADMSVMVSLAQDLHYCLLDFPNIL